MPKTWETVIDVFSGGLIGIFIFQTAGFDMYWEVRLGLAIGGALSGLFLLKYIRQKLISVLKKQAPTELLIKFFCLLGGLTSAYLFIAVLKPVIELMAPLQSVILNLFIVFFGIFFWVNLDSIKLKEWVNLLFIHPGSAAAKPNPGANQLKILDTSAIIDGRIADLCKTNFLEGGLVIPSFVLVELQKIADSPDPLRRNRGRRGLDLLSKIQKENQITVKIFERDYEEINEVDTKLLRLAMELGAKVITNDFNLNKVAELYGVQVLNINELSNAIKPVVLPGEEMVVYVLRDGKEYGQGIGYLEDGTMIVIEGGKSYIGMNIEILVTSVLQTSAGRMIFAKPREHRDYVLPKISS